MHILIVNDDGPPSTTSSPYVHSLVQTLQNAGHIVSVCLPHTQRSWIGKAHMVGQTVKPTYFRPGTLHVDDGTTHSRPLPSGSQQDEWILVDGTPASCVQIGLYHFFQNRSPVDLVVSGPNYGRNSTAIFSLSSGTIGGALEAAVCQRKAIALSYAFFNRNHDPDIIAGASRLSLKLIEYLYKNWDTNVDLYTINVPLVENVETNKVTWTKMLQNYWSRSCFEAIDDESPDPNGAEQKIREEEAPNAANANSNASGHTHKHFKWAPRFDDIHNSVAASGPGNDGWEVSHGYTSVTPLKANFMHAASRTEGEIKLPSDMPEISRLAISPAPLRFHALVDYGDDYVQPLILSALESMLPQGSYTLISSLSSLPEASLPLLQVTSYETLSFDHLMSFPTSSLANSYIIRKALIRKHFLSNTAHNWIAKNPKSIIATNLRPSCDFELDYAEFLDDALIEAWELKASFERNEAKEADDREFWILKPGMSDRGNGIRLFSTEEELQLIFEEWEADLPDSDDAEDAEQEQSGEDNAKDDALMTSHLRHFIAQPYIHPPLLLPGNPRKFHIRTYVLAVGSLKVYVYRHMLALFAAEPYEAPWSPNTKLTAHLTNTCLQNGSREGSVQAFWSLPDSHPDLLKTPSTTKWKDSVFSQICELTGEVFEAAAKGMMVHFQTLPNAFEVFGLDFMVDGEGKTWLLEVNAFPDFKQTGEEWGGVVKGLWEGVVDVAVAPFFGLRSRRSEDAGDMVLVKDVDLGRR